MQAQITKISDALAAVVKAVAELKGESDKHRHLVQMVKRLDEELGELNMRMDERPTAAEFNSFVRHINSLTSSVEAAGIEVPQFHEEELHTTSVSREKNGTIAGSRSSYGFRDEGEHRERITGNTRTRYSADEGERLETHSTRGRFAGVRRSGTSRHGETRNVRFNDIQSQEAQSYPDDRDIENAIETVRNSRVRDK